MKDLIDFLSESILDKSNKKKTMTKVDAVLASLGTGCKPVDLFNAVKKMNIGKPGKRGEAIMEDTPVIRNLYGDVSIDIPIPGANWCTADWGYDSSRRHATFHISLGSSWYYYTVQESDELKLRSNDAILLDEKDAVELAYKLIKSDKYEIVCNDRIFSGLRKALLKNDIWKPGTIGGKDITGHNTVRRASGRDILGTIEAWLDKEDFEF